MIKQREEAHMNIKMEHNMLEIGKMTDIVERVLSILILERHIKGTGQIT